MQFPSELVRFLRASERIAALTGAGISQESGLCTFREAQTGLWTQYKPEDLATPEAFRRNPKLVWDWYAMRREKVRGAEPNPGHYALAEMARRAPRFTLITQNVDGLHQRAAQTLKVSETFFDQYSSGGQFLVDRSAQYTRRDLVGCFGGPILFRFIHHGEADHGALVEVFRHRLLSGSHQQFAPFVAHVEFGRAVALGGQVYHQFLECVHDHLIVGGEQGVDQVRDTPHGLQLANARGRFLRGRLFRAGDRQRLVNQQSHHRGVAFGAHQRSDVFQAGEE
ncbi:hypothetical protein GW866_03320 [bacterium]|nr:hypothetical protein [bacterium]PIW19253.1 MAG: hypothetical protein COW33_05100 [Anaerolineae bacterium CG17_big_fil_post_rev_8_21_14_2_50_57_27]